MATENVFLSFQTQVNYNAITALERRLQALERRPVRVGISSTSMSRMNQDLGLYRKHMDAPSGNTIDPATHPIEVGKLIFTESGEIFADTQYSDGTPEKNGRIPFVGFSDDFRVGRALGGYTVGTTIPKYEKLENIIRMLLGGPSQQGTFSITPSPGSALSSNANREAGYTINSMGLSVNIIKGSVPIERVLIQRTSPTLSVPPLFDNSYNGGTITLTDNDFPNLTASQRSSGTVTYKVQVWDQGENPGLTPHLNTERKIDFLFPAILGSVASPTPDAATLLALTGSAGQRNVVTANTPVSRTFTTSNNNNLRYCCAVPAQPNGWNTLVSVTDQNNFVYPANRFPSVQVTLSFGNAGNRAYNAYVFDDLGLPDNLTLTFRFA